MNNFFLLIITLAFFPPAIHDLNDIRPYTYTINPSILADNKRLIEQKKNITKVQALESLVKDAEKILTKKPYSITNNKAPDGVLRNDYYSSSRYWWPNPETESGFPYILKDGQVNKNINVISDKDYIDIISNDIFVLGMAYYFTENESYARKAFVLLDYFFLRSETRMNPNFDHAQVIPGKDNSGGSIMEAVVLIDVIEGVQLMRGSTEFSNSSIRSLQNWFSTFLNWMENAPEARKNAIADNNRYTYFTLIKCVSALFSGDKVKANNQFVKDAYSLVDAQISADGEMKKELLRATPLGYIKYNLVGFQMLNEVGKKLNHDLYAYVGSQGQSVIKAMDWLSNYQNGSKVWDYSNEIGITYKRRKSLEKVNQIGVNKIRFKPERFDNYLQILITN